MKEKKQVDATHTQLLRGWFGNCIAFLSLGIGKEIILEEKEENAIL